MARRRSGPAIERLVVETVSAVVGTRGRLYDARINGPFDLHLMPIQVGETAGVRLYNVTHYVRFYLEAGETMQFQAATVDGDGNASVSVWGYYLNL